MKFQSQEATRKERFCSS